MHILYICHKKKIMCILQIYIIFQFFTFIKTCNLSFFSSIIITVLLNKLNGCKGAFFLVFWLFGSVNAGSFSSIWINHTSGGACDENGCGVDLSMTQIIAGNWIRGVDFKVEILIVVVLYVDV